MDQIPSFPASRKAVDENKVHGLPELALHDPVHKPVTSAPAEAKELGSGKSKETNPILLVFKAMIVAKGILRNGLKETKDSNRQHERRWEAVVLEVQEQHKKTASSQKKWSNGYALLPVVQLSGIIGAQWFAGKDVAWRAITKTRAENFSKAFPAFFQKATQIVPLTVESVLNTPHKTRKVEGFVNKVNEYISDGILKAQIDNLRVTNEAEQAPLQMKSQSASSLYQNRGSDESSEKQQLSEVDRSMRDLMQQESQVFQGSTGRG